MAASAKITIGLETIELGDIPLGILKKFTITATPDRVQHNLVKQAVADIDEALQVGDISTIETLLIHCITNDVDLDPSFSATFRAGIEVQENEWAIFKPTGTVYFRNNDSGEQSTIEYWIIGTDA